MINTYLITGTEELIKKIENISKDNNIKVIDCDISDSSYLSLNALTPSELKDIWEIITYFSTVGSAYAFLKEIKSNISVSTSNNESITIQTNKGTNITISSSTTEVEIKEFAEKTIIKINK